MKHVYWMKYIYWVGWKVKGGGRVVATLNKCVDPKGTVPLIFNLMMTKNIKQK